MEHQKLYIRQRRINEEGQYIYDKEEEGDSFQVKAQEEQEDTTPASMLLPEIATHDQKKQQKKWGPVQSTRHSNRIQGTSKTILEIAQQKQEIKNLENPPPLKNKGIKPPSFALFNNPKFISIAETVGISLSHSEEVDNYALDHELSSSNTIGVPVAPPQTYLSVLQHSTRSEENYSPSSPVVNSNVAVVDNISSRTPVIVAQTASEDKYRRQLKVCGLEQENTIGASTPGKKLLNEFSQL